MTDGSKKSAPIAATISVPEIKPATAVAPSTYEEIAKLYPSTIDWAKIKENAKETHSIATIKQNSAVNSKENNFEKEHYIDTNEDFFADIENPQIAETNDKWESGVLAWINETNKSIEKAEETLKSKKSNKRYSTVLSGVETHTTVEAEADIEEDDEKVTAQLGYNPKSTYAYKNGRLISNTVEILNNEADVEQIIDKLVYAPLQERIEKASSIISRLHNKDGLECARIYKTYDEFAALPAKSDEVKLFNEISKVVDIPADMLLKFMVDGKIRMAG